MMAHPPIVLFTDFGWSGPYVGQLAAAVLAVDPGARLVHLMHDAPAMRPDLAAYLLPAVSRPLPAGAVVVAVVDPGVGSDRSALIVETARMTFVGPDNGLLARLPDVWRVSRIDWRPAELSASFHGRDLFAPVAARLALGETVDASPLTTAGLVGAEWPPELSRVVYVDGFGNLMTGLAGAGVARDRRIRAGGREIRWAETFSEAAPGELFWYPNSQGLVEIAANGGAAAEILSLAPGDEILLD